MRTEKTDNVLRSGLRYLTPILASGLLALGAVSTASADDSQGYRDGPRHYRDVDYDDDHRNRGHGYGRHKRHRGHETVNVYHHYPKHRVKKVKVIHHYHYEPEPVYVERRRVVERRHYVEPAPAYRRYGPSGNSLIGAAIGGLLGSQVGKGDGKLAATAAGAVTGYWIGGYH